jgi:hypothetical protein
MKQSKTGPGSAARKVTTGRRVGRVLMTSGHNGNRNKRIDALLRREAELKAAIAVEKVKEQKRRDKERERLCAIVGSICVRDGEETPEYKAMLIRTMQGADMSDGDRAFLVRMGWL